MTGKRQALGRGLAALIPTAPASAPTAPAVPPGTSGARTNTTDNRKGPTLLAIEEIHPSRRTQPRQIFDERALGELAESIRAQGIIQPLAVRARKEGGFEIVAGERRWRAAQKAGLREVPVVIVEADETRAFEMALVENLQREDLNPIEEAEGYHRLISEFHYTQEKLAARVGKDRSTIANALRLLRLPEKVRTMVMENRLSMGHARALLGLDSDAAIEQFARQAVARNLSVRAIESLVKKARETQKDGAAPTERIPPRPTPAARDLMARLSRALGTRVVLSESGPGQGRLEIHYHSLDELDRVLARLLPS